MQINWSSAKLVPDKGHFWQGCRAKEEETSYKNLKLGNNNSFEVQLEFSGEYTKEKWGELGEAGISFFLQSGQFF